MKLEKVSYWGLEDKSYLDSREKEIVSSSPCVRIHLADSGVDACLC